VSLPPATKPLVAAALMLLALAARPVSGGSTPVRQFIISRCFTPSADPSPLIAGAAVLLRSYFALLGLVVDEVAVQRELADQRIGMAHAQRHLGMPLQVAAHKAHGLNAPSLPVLIGARENFREIQDRSEHGECPRDISDRVVG